MLDPLHHFQPITMHLPEDTFNPTTNSKCTANISSERNEINHLSKCKDPRNFSNLSEDNSLLICSRSLMCLVAGYGWSGEKKKEIWRLNPLRSSWKFQAGLLPWRLHRTQQAGGNQTLSASLLLQHWQNTKQWIRGKREWGRNTFFPVEVRSLTSAEWIATWLIS